MPPNTINLIKDGHAVEVPADKAGDLLAEGYKPESTEAGFAREQQAARMDSAPGRFVSSALGTARGLTLGLSDVAGRVIGGKTYENFANLAQEAHPDISTVSNVVGAVLPALVGDEAGLAKLTPSGFVSGIGSKVAAAGEGGAALGRVGATALGGAVEGAAQTAGSYVSDVALGNRDLSAEGFLGAMGKGALYGGVAGGALSVASHGLIAARNLFPAEALTSEGVAAAKLGAQNAIGDSVSTSTALEQTGQTAVTQADRETQQFLQDLEHERASTLDQAAQQRTAEEAALPQPGAATADMDAQLQASKASRANAEARTQYIRDQLNAPVDVPPAEAPALGEPAAPSAGESVPPSAAPPAETSIPSPPKDAKQLMNAWREKYPTGSVELDAASAAARKQRLAEWAQDFEPKTPEDETIKAYFSNPMDPGRTAERLGNVEAPKAVQAAARQAAADASHTAYLDATAQGANVSKSGPELMARATYAGRKAAAQAMDDVYAAYAAGKPIVDIRAAATQKLSSHLHEIAEARADMIQSLAKKPDAASDLMAQLQGTKAGLDAGQPLSLGQRILQGVEKPIDPDAAVANALEKSKDVNADIADIAPKITRYEAAKANLTEALGDKASAEAQAHAQAFRAARDQAANANVRATSQAAENIDKTIAGAPAEKTAGGQPLLRGLAKKATDFGAAYEGMRAMGVPLPDLHGIPIVGPILSMFLKAKLMSKAFGKFGGSFAATAEGTIAAKAVSTQNRIAASVGAMIDKTANRLAAAAPEIGASAALGFKLFDDGKKASPYSSEPTKGDTADLFNDRLDELTAAMQPGAIEQAVKSRINVSDPSILDAIVASETQKLQYLYNIAPKPSGTPLPGQPQRDPSRTEMLEFGIVTAAHHDPAAIFERVANGGTARPSEIDYVHNCTPQLLRAAQGKLVDMLSTANAALPYERRVAVSALLGVPLDSTVQPDHAAYLQAGIAQPSAPRPPAPPPHPTLTASIGIGDRTLTRLDQ